MPNGKAGDRRSSEPGKVRFGTTQSMRPHVWAVTPHLPNCRHSPLPVPLASVACRKGTVEPAAFLIGSNVDNLYVFENFDIILC